MSVGNARRTVVAATAIVVVIVIDVAAAIVVAAAATVALIAVTVPLLIGHFCSRASSSCNIFTPYISYADL